MGNVQLRVHRAGLMLCAVIAALVLLGCSSGSDPNARTEEFGLTEAQLETKIEAVESAIASCMKDAGFEYIPIDTVTLRKAMQKLGTAPGLSDEEFVSQYGYGITTLPPTRDFGVGEKNAAIFDDLDPASQTAYLRTLFGDDPGATFMLSLDDENFASTGGCTRKAIEQSFSAEDLSVTYINPIDAQVEQDPRMVDAREKWADCMAQEGYDYARQENAEDDLLQRMNAITEGADPGTLTGSAKDALTDLQGEERAIAQVDFACSERFLNDVEEEVERDVLGREPK